MTVGIWMGRPGTVEYLDTLVKDFLTLTDGGEQNLILDRARQYRDTNATTDELMMSSHYYIKLFVSLSVPSIRTAKIAIWSVPSEMSETCHMFCFKSLKFATSDCDDFAPKTCHLTLSLSLGGIHLQRTRLCGDWVCTAQNAGIKEQNTPTQHERNKKRAEHTNVIPDRGCCSCSPRWTVKGLNLHYECVTVDVYI